MIKKSRANRWLRQIGERVVRADRLEAIVSAPYPRTNDRNLLGARDTLIKALELRPKIPFSWRHAGVGICYDDAFERDISEGICCALVPVSHVRRHDPCLVLAHFKRV